jgi:hypothetical protein
LIRQAISCDICGAEKKHTNHWYVTCEQGGEMRLGGWNSRMRQRPNAKHLCGQTCLHKLLDEFMARTSAARAASAGTESVEGAEPVAPRAEVDASLTSFAAYEEDESSARLIETPAAAAPVFPMQPRLVAEPVAPAPTAPPKLDDTPNYSPRRWRAEAWERERNRELRAIDRRPELTRHHKS